MSAAHAPPESTQATQPSALLLACLCAQWCGTCREYRESFVQVARALREHWGHRLNCVWVDVEDHADALDSPDIENFPSLLLAAGDQVLFWGPVLPHVAAAQRLAERCFESAQASKGSVTGIAHPEQAQALLAAVQSLLLSKELETLQL